MGINNEVADRSEETAAKSDNSSKSSCCMSIKNTIADKLHDVAEALGEKTSDHDGQCVVAQYGQRASEWLEESAEYVRQLDCKQADAGIREYVRQSPGRSLLIAGAIGLIIGAIWRHR